MAWIHNLLMPSWRVRRAFPSQVRGRLTQRIRDCEARHGGEIRLVVEASLDLPDLIAGRTVEERALASFGGLGVWDTEHNNGVLVYVLFAEHTVAIVADRGIDRRVPAGSWDEICALMRDHFAAGRFEAGAMAGIDRVSALLAAHFPEPDGNELPDEVVFV